MLGIAVFGIVAYRALPVSDLPNVDFPTLNVSAGLPGRRSGDDGVGGREPARAPVHDHCRHRRDDLVELDRRHERHAAVRSRPRHRQRRRRRADGDRRGDAAAAGRHAGAAVVPQVQSGRPADHVPRAHLRRRADVRRSTTTPRRSIAPRISMVSGVVAGAGAGRAEVRGPRPGGSGQAARTGHRHQRGRHRAAELERQPAHRTAVRRRRHVQHQRRRPADECRRVSGRSSSSYRNGAPVRLDQVAHVIDSVEDNRNASWLYTKDATAARDQPPGDEAAGHATRSRSTDAMRRLLPAFEAAAAAVRAPDRSAAIARRTSARRSRDIQLDDARSRSCSSSA